MNSSQFDEKVVSLSFNNSNFEKNVKTSLSTLDKLKNAFNFKKSTESIKSVDSSIKNLNSSVKSVSFSPITKGIQEVHNNFSALEVAGVTALSNITNSAINAGKNIVSALTIDPVKSGFQEYETQINAIQTILANTKSKGTTLEDVMAALDELNLYADKTIYNFTEMTRNIGTFTAAGVDLDTSVAAIKGIANLAAVSGSTSQQASTAMYQLSQALAAGRVSLMDWNSVVNAGMGGQVFQDALKETARVHGIAIDEMIEQEGSFRETLTEYGWITNDILTETLAKFTGDLTEDQLRSIGYTEEQIAGIIDLGKTANDAATKVKTFTQLIDTTKEALQSGWTNTWELIIGDFDGAISIFSTISEFLNKIIEDSANSRNQVVEDAIYPWRKLERRLEKVGVSMDDFRKISDYVLRRHGMNLDDLINEYGSFESSFRSGWLSADIFNEIISELTGGSAEAEEAISGVSHTVEEYEDIVNSVIRGDWGNGQDRFDALTAAGWDWQVVQDLVNQQLATGTFSLENLSDAQLKSIGYTEDQIKAIRELGIEALEADSEMNQVIEDLKQPAGRDLITDTIDKSLKILQTTLEYFGTAFENVFGSLDSGSIYDFIVGVNEFVTNLYNSEGLIHGIAIMFEGVFSIFKLGIDIVWYLGESLFNLVYALLGIVGLDDKPGAVFGFIGTQLKNFANWFRGSDIVDAIQSFGGLFSTVFLGIAQSLKDFFTTLLNSENGQSFLGYWSGVISTVQGIFGGMFGKLIALFDHLSGKFNELVENGLTPESLADFISTLFGSLVALVKQTGSNLVNALSEPFDNVYNFIIEFISKLITNVDSYLSSLEFIGPIYKVIKEEILEFIEAIKSNEGVLGFMDSISSVFDVFKNLPEGISNAFSTFVENIKSFGDNLTFENLVSEVKSFIKAVISLIPGLSDVIYFIKDLFTSIQTFATQVFGIFSSIGSNITSGLEGGIQGGFSSVISLIASIASGIISSICSILGIQSPSTVMKTIGGFIIAGLVLGMLTNSEQIVSAITTIATNISNLFANMVENAQNIGQQLGIGFSNLLANVINFVSGLGSGIASAFDSFVSGGGAVGGEIMAFFSSLIQMLSDLPILSVVLMIALTSFGKSLQETVGIVSDIGGAIDSLAKAQKIKAIGSLFKGVAVSLLAFAASAYVISQIPLTQLAQSGVAIVLFIGIVGGLAFALSKMDEADPKQFIASAANLIMIAVSIGILSGAVALLASMNPGKVATGIAELFFIIAEFMMASIFLNGVLQTVDADSSKLRVSLTNMAMSLILMVAAIKLITMIDFDTYIVGLIRLATILAALVGAITIISIVSKSFEGTHKVFSGLALSLLALVASVAVLGAIKSENLVSGTLFLGVILLELLGFLVTFGAVGQYFEKEIPKIAGVIAAIGAAILGFSLSMKLFSTIDSSDTIQVLSGFVAFVIGLGGLLKILSGKTTELKGVGTALISMAATMFFLTASVKLFGMMSTDNLNQGLTAVIILLLVMGVTMRLASLAAGTKSGKFKSFMVAIIALVGAALALTLLPSPDQVEQAQISIGAMIALMLAFGVMTRLSAIDTSKMKFSGLIVSIAILAGAVAAIIAVSSLFKPEAGVVMAASIGLMGVIGILSRILSQSKDLKVKDAAALFIASNAMVLAISSLLILSQFSLEDMVASVIGVGLIISGLGMAMNSAKDFKAKNLLSILVGLEMLLLGLYAMNLMARYPIDNAADILYMVGAFAGIVVSIGLCAKLCEGVKFESLAGLLLGAGLIAAIGYAFSQIAVLDFKQLATTAGLLVGIVGGLALVVTILGNLAAASGTGAIILIGIAAGMVVFATAAGILAEVLNVLAGIDSDSLEKSLTALGKGMAELGKSAGFGIAAAIAIALLGIALIPASVGLMLFAGAVALASVALNFFGTTFMSLSTAIAGGLSYMDAVFSGLSDTFRNFGVMIVSGLTGGILGAMQAPMQAITAVGAGIMSSFCGMLGIHSPAKTFVGYGGNIIEGLVNGLLGNAGAVVDPIKGIADLITGTFEGEMPDLSNIGKDLIGSFTGMFDGNAIGESFLGGLGNQFDVNSFYGRQAKSKFDGLVDHMTLDDLQQENILSNNEKFSGEWAESLTSGIDGMNIDINALYNTMGSGFTDQDLPDFTPDGSSLNADAEGKGQDYANSYKEALKKYIQYGIENGWFTPEEVSAKLGIHYDPLQSDEEFVNEVQSLIDSGEYVTEVEVAIDGIMGKDFVKNTVGDLVIDQILSGELDPNKTADALGLPYVGNYAKEELAADIKEGLENGTLTLDELLSTLDYHGLSEGLLGSFDDANEEIKGSLDETNGLVKESITNAEDYYKTALDVVRGYYGDGTKRIEALKAAGFTDEEIALIQDIVNKMYELGKFEDFPMEEVESLVDQYGLLIDQTDKEIERVDKLEEKLEQVNKDLAEKKNPLNKNPNSPERLEETNKEVGRVDLKPKELKTPREQLDEDLKGKMERYNKNNRSSEIKMTPQVTIDKENAKKAADEYVGSVAEQLKNNTELEDIPEAFEGAKTAIEEAFDGLEPPKLVDKAYADELETNTEAVTNSTKTMETNVSKAANEAAASMEGIRKRTKTTTHNMIKDSSLGGKAMPTAMSSAIDSNKGSVASSVNSVHDITRAPFTNSYSEWHRFGSNMGQGLLDGLSAKEPLIKERAAAMGLAANEAFAEAEEIHSPSKIWEEYGKYIGQGLTNGMMSEIANVLDASKNLSDSASYGISNTMSKLDLSTIGNDASRAVSEALKPINKLDFESLEVNPVIRPVLDLTDIESKAATLGSMLNSPSLSVKVIPDLGSSIGKNQNGSDILKALNDLKGSLGGNVTNYNSIGNIIYDEDSSIANAIETIVQETIMEGRM